LKSIISFWLEPVSLLLYLGALLTFTLKFDRRFHFRVLTGYYLIASIIMLKVFRGPNISVYNILYVFNALALGQYFYSLLIGKGKRIVVIVLVMVPVIYYIVNNVVFGGEEVFDSLGYVFSSIVIVVMIFMFLSQTLANVSEERLSMNFNFWYVASQLIYQLGAFIVFLTFNYLTKKILTADYSHENRAVLTKLWGLHNVLLFLSALLTIFGVVWISSHKKSPSS
jgi:hypothetical protein